MIFTETYKVADISGKEEIVSSLVLEWIDKNKGITVEEQRVRLPVIKKAVGECVSFIEDKRKQDETLPRVDGYSVRPILTNLVKEVELSLIPDSPEVEEVLDAEAL